MCQPSGPDGAGTPPGQEIHTRLRKADPRMKVPELATSQINASDQLVIELVQGDTTPAAILIRWPNQPTVTQPNRFDTTV